MRPPYTTKNDGKSWSKSAVPAKQQGSGLGYLLIFEIEQGEMRIRPMQGNLKNEYKRTLFLNL